VIEVLLPSFAFGACILEPNWSEQHQAVEDKVGPIRWAQQVRHMIKAYVQKYWQSWVYLFGPFCRRQVAVGMSAVFLLLVGLSIPPFFMDSDDAAALNWGEIVGHGTRHG
jgi:hypothetical protein